MEYTQHRGQHLPPLELFSDVDVGGAGTGFILRSWGSSHVLKLVQA